MKIENVIAGLGVSTLLLSCGTLTGIPSHGGGKRFSEEQRLVASSIKLSVQQIDVSSLLGKNVGIVFGLMSDEGGGNLVGGRATITAILTQGQATSPSSSTNNSVEMFQIANANQSTENATGTSSGSSTSTGTNTGTSATSSSSSSTNTSNGTSTADTTSQVSTTANQTTVTTSSSTNTGTETGNSSTNSSGTQSSSGTNQNNSTSTQTSAGSGTSQQAIVTGSETTVTGEQSQANLGIQYEGLGQYQNLAVPKSDAAFLMSELRNHLILNGVTVRSPADPAAEIFLYVSVPILGTNRSRTDILVYNQESLRAETYIEAFAINRAGEIVLPPQVGNFRTYYKENYIAWSGPYHTRRGSELGLGLIEEIEVK